MKDEHLSPQALIAGYKSGARPSPDVQARIWSALAEAQRAARTDPPRRSRTAPWLALAAGLVLFGAWCAQDLQASRQAPGAAPDLAQYAASGAPATAEVAAPSKAAAPFAPEAELRLAPAAERALAGDGSLRPKPSRLPLPSAADPTAAVLAEVALLERAKAELQDKRPAVALALLDRHAADHADGVLTEEREALRALARCAAGDVSTGRSVMQTFLRAHPRSTYAARVRAACEGKRAGEATQKD